jgi:hypothetical protein
MDETVFTGYNSLKIDVYDAVLSMSSSRIRRPMVLLKGGLYYPHNAVYH